MEILVCLGLGVGVIGVKFLILYFLNKGYEVSK
jgi:hypothetical protein